MHQKKRLTRERDGTSTADFTESGSGDLSARTGSFGAATPVGDAVDAANRVSSKAFHRTGDWRSSGAEIVVFVGGFRGQKKDGGRIVVLGSNQGKEGEGEDGDGNG